MINKLVVSVLLFCVFITSSIGAISYGSVSLMSTTNPDLPELDTEIFDSFFDDSYVSGNTDTEDSDTEEEDVDEEETAEDVETEDTTDDNSITTGGSTSGSTDTGSTDDSSSGSTDTGSTGDTSTDTGSSGSTSGGSSATVQNFSDITIMGTSVYTAAQLVELYWSRTSAQPKLTCTLEELAQYYIDEGAAEGVRGDIAFIQALHETGNFQYGGDVSWDQNNFAGLGATGGVPGNSFATAQIGVRAQIQHLKCYGSYDALNNVCVDPRWWDALRGKAIYFVDLAGTWAADTTYASKLEAIYNILITL